MSVSDKPTTSMLLEYGGPDGVRGYLAYSGVDRPLAAGGMRVQAGLSAETVVALAEAMALKEKVLRLNVDGAKCGIDYDPGAPGKHEAMRNFLRWLKPHLETRLSVGPDMGTTFGEIETLARAEGIPSVKGSIAAAQGLPREQVIVRLKTLESRVGPLSVGERRAGQALAHAALAAAKHRHLLATGSPLRCALQGFGTLGRGAALTLDEAGIRLTAIADEHGCLRRENGIDVPRLLTTPQRTPVTAASSSGVGERLPRDAVLDEPTDLLVLAACENAVSLQDIERLRASVVVVGANNGLRPDVEHALAERDILVIPDFVGGAGGSAAMDALFAPQVCSDPVTVLGRVALVARRLVQTILAAADSQGTTPREAALAAIAESRVGVHEPPYGLRLLEGIDRSLQTTARPGEVGSYATV